ncbi:MAG: pilus assembly protein CpaE [Frankiales bacterium]|jgi:pilus assembly protein CpaE|nr:pilus assembly protein CpaE [Frankiales bacterium]
MTILVEGNGETAAYLQSGIGPCTVVENLAMLRRGLEHAEHDVVVIGPDIDLDGACEFASSERVTTPARGVVLVRRRVDSHVLTSALKSGVREVVAHDNLQQINESCRAAERVSRDLRAAQQLPTAGHDSADAGQLITVFSAKGGCGKTTVTTNLAVALAAQGNSVCIVDLDLAFGDVAIVMQLFPGRTIADAVALTNLDPTAVQSIVTRYGTVLDTILAPVEPGLAESIPAATVVSLLRVLKTMYQYVIVDTPPAFTEHVLAALDETDWMMLLATLDIPALKNLKLTLETLDILGFAADRRLLVLNRSDAQVGLKHADVQAMLGGSIALHIPSSRAVPASVNRGVPLVSDQPGHVVSQAILKFARTQFPAADAVGQPRARRGFARHRKVEAL